MNKDEFLKQCGKLRPLAENILGEVDNSNFRLDSHVVNKKILNIDYMVTRKDRIIEL